MALDWSLVLERLQEVASISALPDGQPLWRSGQEDSLRWLAERLADGREPGVLIADEVGLGKTRLAIAVAVCVAASGGRVVVLVPPGLNFQWGDEELPALLHQLAFLNLPWLPKISARFLRTYRDLFSAASSWPLARQSSLLLISHRFGLPSFDRARDTALWKLPYLVRKAAGQRTWGVASLAKDDPQREAAAYLAKHCDAAMRKDLTTLKGRPDKLAFNEPRFARMFRHLIGDLIGDVDLLIVDEAHKARAGTLGRTDARRPSTFAEVDEEDDSPIEQPQDSSRLTFLIDEVILRSGTRPPPGRRIALTATPMELEARQWRTIFTRLGHPPSRIADLEATVEAFATSVQALRAGSAAEIERLADAAQAFQKKLSAIVTRRIWRDDPDVRRYARAVGDERSAHPHRRYIVENVALSDLDFPARHRIALSEALAAAARGSASAYDLKTAGIRFSQALPMMPESATSPEKGECTVELVEDSASKRQEPAVAIDPGEAARQQRLAYWRHTIDEVDRAQFSHELASEPAWVLQWHPRVRRAIDLIERLAADGDKVLVFGEFVLSLRAIDRALNIRHYLRHLAAGTPIPLPQGVSLRDADLRRWREDPASGLAGLSDEHFGQLAAEGAHRYERDRVGLRDVCRQFVDESADLAELSAPKKLVLTTWLVQQLCVEGLLWDTSSPAGRQALLVAAQTQIAHLRREHDAKQPSVKRRTPVTARSGWLKVIEQELQLGDDGNYVFRMTARCQMMIGGTRATTRRTRQANFNHPQLNPRILVGQSDIVSEGLNLHRSCRTVVPFHLDWNPGRIEQQIGRVDRQDSAWMLACRSALERAAVPVAPLPTLDVHSLSVQGTYDSLRAQVIESRTRVFRSQVFGEILPADRLALLPPEAQQAVLKMRIDFTPAAALSAGLSAEQQLELIAATHAT